jgi:hypothetical protein
MSATVEAKALGITAVVGLPFLWRWWRAGALIFDVLDELLAAGVGSYCCDGG